MRTDQEVGGEVEVVGGGAVDGVAVVGWFNDLDVSPTIEGPRLRAAWATKRAKARSSAGPIMRSVFIHHRHLTEIISKIDRIPQQGLIQQID